LLRTERLEEATAPDGTVLTLFRHGRDYYLRVGTVELMSTRRPHSEEKLAELGCAHLAGVEGARVLIGGLGFGFTLREALRQLGPDATVVVAEFLPEVVAWNRNPEYGLAGPALDDPRLELRVEDVGDTLRAHRGSFDAVLLDVDNGAGVFTSKGNAELYKKQGVRAALAALRPGGRLAYWSADYDVGFAELLRGMGLTVEIVRARAHVDNGGWHSVIFAHEDD
jgi:spermidine synthase